MKYQTHVYSNFLQRCCLFVDKSIKRFKKYIFDARRLVAKKHKNQTWLNYFIFSIKCMYLQFTKFQIEPKL